MAVENVRRRGIGGKAPSRNHIVEEFVPYSGWTEDVNGRYLLIDLPGNESCHYFNLISEYSLCRKNLFLTRCLERKTFTSLSIMLG